MFSIKNYKVFSIKSFYVVVLGEIQSMGGGRSPIFGTQLLLPSCATDLLNYILYNVFLRQKKQQQNFDQTKLGVLVSTAFLGHFPATLPCK